MHTWSLSGSSRRLWRLIRWQVTLTYSVRNQTCIEFLLFSVTRYPVDENIISRWSFPGNCISHMWQSQYKTSVAHSVQSGGFKLVYIEHHQPEQSRLNVGEMTVYFQYFIGLLAGILLDKWWVDGDYYYVFIFLPADND